MDMPSRFVFDGLVFDVEYFRQKMEEHRQRTAGRMERVREMLAASRSPAIAAGPLDLANHPGLLDALDALVDGSPVALQIEPRSRFDLKAYQAHVQANLGTLGRDFDEIPALRSDDRFDRVWRFIAVIFLAHEGRVRVVQDGEEIMVMQRETDREGQDISGELEEADGVEGLVG
jgi:chromatin segregation and condensation protein Rec8/ScpA/Scc1 (kleisin family)